MVWLHPVVGLLPPDVFSRWMNVVCERIEPPVGPLLSSGHFDRSHGIAPASTKFGSLDISGSAPPHTRLLSTECCQVGRKVFDFDRVGAEVVRGVLTNGITVERQEQRGSRADERPLHDVRPSVRTQMKFWVPIACPCRNGEFPGRELREFSGTGGNLDPG